MSGNGARVYSRVGLQEHRVTVAHIVPPIALLLAKHPSVAQYDVSSLRAVFSGAAPLSRT